MDALTQVAVVDTWCSRYASRAEALFSAALRPQRTVGSIVAESASWPRLGDGDINEIGAAVEVVLKSRSRLLQAEGVQIGSANVPVKLLAYYPALTDFSELSMETGIVDRADTPAWDLWVGVGMHPEQFCILSHIPLHFAGLAERAIGLSPTSALRWVAPGEVRPLK